MVETRHLVPMRRPCAVLGCMNGLDHERKARRRRFDTLSGRKVLDVPIGVAIETFWSQDR